MKQTFYFLCFLVFSALTARAQITPILEDAKKQASKLNNQLLSISKTYQKNKRLDSSLISVPSIRFDKSTERILVNAVAETDTLAMRAELIQAGAELVSSYGRIITCWVPVAGLAALDTLKACRFVRPAYRPRHRTGPVTSQGDNAQRSDVARTNYGVNGKGVKVGIMSDSYAVLPGVNASILAGELPGIGNPNGFTTAVTNVKDYTLSDASDEGRGMLEIVHDVAPGAQLYFRTAYFSNTDFATGIQQLANLGCKVIVDDIGYLEEPFFQDGIIAQSVDNVHNTNGVSFFSAAGNSGNVSYENNYLGSAFNPLSYTSTTAHNFGTVANPVYFLPISLASLREMMLTFQWDNPFFSVSGGAGATADLDIYLLRSIPTTFPLSSSLILAASEDFNIGRDALEFLTYQNNTGSTRTYYLMITKYEGTNPTRLKFIENYDATFPASATSIVGVGASTCFGHPNAARAIATGAVPFFRTAAFGVNPPIIQSYSSRGGTPIYFNTAGVRLASPITRQKPEIAAPDGGNTSFFGSDSSQDTDTFPNFFGTSASAPHAGAVAALMLQANPTITPATVKTALTASCVDMDDPTTGTFDVGFDYATGFGLIQADVAIKAVKPPSLTCTSLVSGNWNSTATWSCGTIPVVTTLVTINSNHVVTINGGTVRAKKVVYIGTGKLSFSNNSILRLGE